MDVYVEAMLIETEELCASAILMLPVTKAMDAHAISMSVKTEAMDAASLYQFWILD
jgi:hypothetical protein